MVGEENVHLETIVWPGGDIIPVSTGRGSRSIFRIVTAFAPPFVMIGELDEDGQCLRGNFSSTAVLKERKRYYEFPCPSIFSTETNKLDFIWRHEHTLEFFLFHA